MVSVNGATRSVKLTFNHRTSGTVYVVGNRKTFLKYTSAGGVEERENGEVRREKCEATVTRGVLFVPIDSRQNTAYRVELFDISGRNVRCLAPGPNDVTRLAPGVYFVREQSSVSSRRSGPATVRKVVVTR